MIIFLSGQDTYRAREKLKEIIEHYQKVHKSGLNLRYFEGKDLNFQDFKDEFQQTSMFKEKKLAILKNVFQNQKFKEEFLENKKIFLGSKEIILFYEEGGIPENDKLAIFLKKNGKTQEFQLLESQKLKNWLKKEFEKYKAKIEPKALEKFISFVGSDLWRASNEIKKLISYKNLPRLALQNFEGFAYSKEAIEVKDIELLVKPKIETDIFATIDAIAEKNKKRALQLIHQHLVKGDSPLYLLAMINFQFRNLLIVKEKAGFSIPYGQLGMHPFVAKKAREQAKKFSFEELKKIYHKIFEVDQDIKTGRLDPQTALDLLIVSI